MRTAPVSRAWLLLIAAVLAATAGESPSDAWAKVLLAARDRCRGLQEEEARDDAFAPARASAPDCTASFAGLAGGSLSRWSRAVDDDATREAVRRYLTGLPPTSAWRRQEEILGRTQAPAAAWLALFHEAWSEAIAVRRAEVPRLACVRRGEYGLRGTNATMFAHRTGRGSAVVLIDPAQPQAEPKVVYEVKDGFIWDLSPTWDGRRLLMSCKERNDDPFHIWELDPANGKARQITTGPYHDFNPVEYPDGRIVFSSSRVESYSLCQDFLASALHVVNGDGANLRRFDFTTLCTMKPSVMPDGTILCTRWEYNDKNIFSWQGLWTIHPDGRQLKLYYGNTLTIPNSRYGGVPVPGTDQILITMAGHHHPPVGDIALVDRHHGVEAVEGMSKVTHETSYQPTKGRTWKDLNWHPGDKYFPWSVCDPWPLRDGLFLASFGREPAAGRPGRFSICVATYDGVRWPVVDLPGASYFSPVVVAPRSRPPAIPTEVPIQAGEGTFFVQDVYQGLLEQGVQRGQVASLRILRHTPKKWNTEGPRFHDHYPIVGYGSYYVKDNLGEVPVDEEGSVYFRAPSNCELSFIALDRQGREVQRMGTVLQVTTGERVSCVGCHEDRQKAPPASMGKAPRLARSPDVIRPPPWGAGPFDYVKHVQPVWDRHCTSCHAGRTPAATIDCSGDKTRFFSMSYDHLVRFTDYYYINPGPTGVFPALKTGSQISRLAKLIEEKHGGVDLDDDSRRRVYAWIDSNVQYYPTWDMSRPHTIGGRDPWFFCPDDKRVMPQPEPWFLKLCGFYATNCAKCHEGDFADYARYMTGETTERGSRKPLKPGRERLWAGEHPIDRWINMTRPEHSRLLNAHLAKAAGGLELTKKGKEALVWRDADDAGYRSLLEILREGAAALKAKPRMDMPGGKAVPQERNFGKVF